MNDSFGTQEEKERVDVGGGLVPEELPSLADFADEVGGAWPKGWYAAEVIEGYATGKGTIFTTKDEVSRAGDSRNLTICFRVTHPQHGERNTFAQINYRTSDFTAGTLAAVKEAREQFKGSRGAWIGQKDLQRSSLALGQLGQIEGALGFRLKLHPSGHILPSALVTQKMDVRFTINEDGYNDINAYAKAGTRVK